MIYIIPIVLFIAGYKTAGFITAAICAVSTMIFCIAEVIEARRKWG